jgi:hypothetical protein
VREPSEAKQQRRSSWKVHFCHRSKEEKVAILFQLVCASHPEVRGVGRAAGCLRDQDADLAPRPRSLAQMATGLHKLCELSQSRKGSGGDAARDRVTDGSRVRKGSGDPPTESRPGFACARDRGTAPGEEKRWTQKGRFWRHPRIPFARLAAWAPPQLA